MSKPNDFRVTEHFSLAEFACAHGACPHCGGVVKIEPKLVYGLEAIRSRLGKPIHIASGYRCAAHNREVGGLPDSFHVQGKAADLASIDTTKAAIARVALELGDLRVGFYSKGGNQVLHVDTADPAATGLPKTWGDLWPLIDALG